MSVKDSFLDFAKSKGIPVSISHKEADMPEDLHIMIEGEHGRWEGIALPFEEENLLIFYVNMEVMVPEDLREKMADFMMKKNYFYKYGGLYMDTKTGIVITRCSMHIYGTVEERQELINKAVYTSAVIADQEYQNICALVETLDKNGG